MIELIVPLIILFVVEGVLMGVCLLLKRNLKSLNSSKLNELFSTVILVLSFIFIFELIYWAFYIPQGFPPGPGLTNADWLSFLSGYLGFAGALIMAWLVYKQDKKINELTMQEYQVVFRPIVEGLNTKTYTDQEASYVFYKLENQIKLYAKHDIDLVSSKTPGENIGISVPEVLPVFYFSIVNTGKLKVDKFCFDEVNIVSPEDGIKKYQFSFRKSNGGNILNGSYSILPGSSLYACLILHTFPKQMPTSRFELSFHYFIGAHQESQSAEFWVERNTQGILFFTDGENEVHL